MNKKAKWGLLGLITAGLGGLAAAGSALYRTAMVPRPRNTAGDGDDPALYREGRLWAAAGEGFQSAELTSVDGLRLWAALVPAEKDTHRWVICLHGFRDDHTSMGLFGRHWHEAGWNVLMPDQRGFGNSEGDYIGWGYDERLDLVRWIAWITRRDPEAEIVLHGVSMGAATVLMATGGPLPKNVKAAISDCAYTDIESGMRHVAENYKPVTRKLSGLSGAVFSVLRRTVQVRDGIDLRDAAPIQSVERSSTPTLFVHGTEDDFVPAAMMKKLYRAAKCPKSFLWVPGAGHAVEAAVAPELYWSSVDTFLESYLP